MSENQYLLDKVCVVTGAGKGIGAETARLFWQHGAKLALISRTAKDLELLEQELGPDSERLLCAAGDVSELEVVNNFVESVMAKFGRIDVLVNNAGIRMRKPFVETSYDDWSNVIRVNAGSTFLFCKAVAGPMMRQGAGKIINMASVVGTLGLPELAAYAASKGAIISLTKSLAVEWAGHGINVNVVAPGFCETSYAESFKEKTELYQFTLDRTPAGRWGSGKDIANACLYLGSELSDYVSGEVLSVDGGWSAW